MITTTPQVVSVVLQKWQYPVPDEHWVANAYPFADQVKAVAIEVERGSFTKRYEMREIRALLKQQPMLTHLGGMGHPEPTPGLLQTGGRHTFSRTVTHPTPKPAGKIILAR